MKTAPDSRFEQLLPPIKKPASAGFFMGGNEALGVICTKLAIYMGLDAVCGYDGCCLACG